MSPVQTEREKERHRHKKNRDTEGEHEKEEREGDRDRDGGRGWLQTRLTTGWNQLRFQGESTLSPAVATFITTTHATAPHSILRKQLDYVF